MAREWAGSQKMNDGGSEMVNGFREGELVESDEEEGGGPVGVTLVNGVDAAWSSEDETDETIEGGGYTLLPSEEEDIQESTPPTSNVAEEPVSLPTEGQGQQEQTVQMDECIVIQYYYTQLMFFYISSYIGYTASNVWVYVATSCYSQLGTKFTGRHLETRTFGWHKERQKADMIHF